jgi:L-lactate dehydrogenase (cytochrome)
VMIGRAYAYGLGALGERGVALALELIEKELDVTLALCGLRDVKDASPAILRSA